LYGSDADQLFNGRKFMVLTLVDNFSRLYLAILVGQSIRRIVVVRIMEDVKLSIGINSERIQVHNESKFNSKDKARWAYENNVSLDFSRPGKPTDNSYIESFNGSFRDECLNVNCGSCQWIIQRRKSSNEDISTIATAHIVL